MKKVRFVLLILLTMFLLGGSVKAVDGLSEVFLVKSIEIQSTTSTYTTGTVLTIKLKNTDGDVEITDPPELLIQFGNGKEIEIKCSTNPGRIQELQYVYTIKDSDIGKLKILREQQITSTGKGSYDLSNITLDKDIIANSDKVTDNKEENTLTWTDFSNATFEWKDYTKTDHSSPSLNINNVILKTEKHYYYFYLSHNKNDEPDLNKIGEDLNYWKLISSDGKIASVNLTSYLETNGDIYIWIAEVQNRDKRIVLNAKKIDRLEQLPLTKRIVGYFSDSLAGGILCYEPYTSTERKINIKIGKMTDNTILKDMKENKNNAITDLLNYAKKTNSIFEKTYSFGENSSIPDNVKFENKGYYFIYFELEDENGKYYPVEDVELYQASVSGKNVDLINHTDRNFVYNLGDDTNINTENNENTDNSKDNTIATGKIPQTGIDATIIFIITMLTAIAGFVAYKITKYKDIK